MRRQSMRHAILVVLGYGIAWGCTALPPCAAPPNTAPSASPAAVLLQQRVKEQDKRIADLTTQLNLLKQIDHSRMKDR